MKVPSGGGEGEGTRERENRRMLVGVEAMRIGEKGENLHGATPGRAGERQDIVDPGEEHGPADARWAG